MSRPARPSLYAAVYLEALQLVGDDGRAVVAGEGAGHRPGTPFDRLVLESR